jgi:hypothetical protein
MIIIASKVQVRRGLERELPGTPISTDPLVLGAGLDLGEIGMSTDTGRTFIGYVPSDSDAIYQRGVFPYQNLEILTENSPRNAELFSGFIKDQDEEDFFLPVAVAQSGVFVNFGYPDGEFDPSLFIGSSISAAVEYHAFSTAGQPVKQGIIRILGGGGSAVITDTENIEAVSGLAFSTTSDSGSLHLTVQNQTGFALNVYLRRVFIGIQSHGSLS